MKPKIVIVTMFEPDGEVPGELALLKEREGLIPLNIPSWGLDRLYGVPERGIFVLLAGVGTANTAVSLMTLGLATGWDFRETLWLIAGIAGGNPHACSLGSPVWADWVVDGDLGHEIDSRDMPADWPMGIFPLGSKGPLDKKPPRTDLFGESYQVFRLNTNLVSWAYNLTSDLALMDNAELEAMRHRYEGFANAVQSPMVCRGDSISGARFWHGDRHNDWAAHWMSKWTAGEGKFFTSAMEDTGTLLALKQLDRMGRLDFNKVLLLRSVSNYTMPPTGVDPVSNLIGDHGAHYPGYVPALENNYRVVRRILDELE